MTPIRCTRSMLESISRPYGEQDRTLLSESGGAQRTNGSWGARRLTDGSSSRRRKPTLVGGGMATVFGSVRCTTSASAQVPHTPQEGDLGEDVGRSQVLHGKVGYWQGAQAARPDGTVDGTYVVPKGLPLDSTS